MRLGVLAILLVSVAAHARPGALVPPQSAVRDGDQLVHIDKSGSGESPEHSDEVTYRYDLFKDRDPAQATHEQKTRRMTDSNDRILANLLEMHPGEVRRIWFAEQDGNLCDHFGCAHGPDPYAATLELISVTPHHATLPDDMHITAWPLLGVRKGKLWAPLGAKFITKIDTTHLDGDVVTIDLVSHVYFANVPPVAESVHYTLDELRARLEHATGVATHNWQTAEAAFARASKLDPRFDEAAVDHATALLALHHLPQAAAAIAPVAKRNPVWLYWKVMVEPSLKPLRTLPVITDLRAHTAGTFDPSSREMLPNSSLGHYRDELSPHQLGMAAEPSGRFLVAFSEAVMTADNDGGHPFRGMKIIDRVSGEVVGELPYESNDPNHHSAGFLAAWATMHDLGFVELSAEAPVLSYGDPEQGLPQHPRLVFNGLELALAADRGSTSRRFIAITPPAGQCVNAGVRVGDLVIYRWGTWNVGDVTIAHVPAA